jgi:hypothetical protein
MKTSSGSSSIVGIPGTSAVTSPPMTRRIGYGMRVSCARASRTAAETRISSTTSVSCADSSIRRFLPTGGC